MSLKKTCSNFGFAAFWYTPCLWYTTLKQQQPCNLITVFLFTYVFWVLLFKLDTCHITVTFLFDLLWPTVLGLSCLLKELVEFSQSIKLFWNLTAKELCSIHLCHWSRCGFVTTHYGVQSQYYVWSFLLCIWTQLHANIYSVYSSCPLICVEPHMRNCKTKEKHFFLDRHVANYNPEMLRA